MKQQTIITAILSGALLATGCASTSSSRAHSGYSDGSLVGAWRGKIQFKTGTFSTIKDLEFMYVFNAGGTMTESSNYSRECGSLRSRRTCRRQRNLHQCGVPWDHQYANGCGHVG